MVFRAFLAAGRLRILGLLTLGLAIGALEGGFVYLIKVALSGDAGSWRSLLGLAFVLVTLRCLLQAAAAGLETKAVFGWIATLRAGLLSLAGSKRFPAYRDPWRGQLARALDLGLREMAEGAAAGLRGFSALAQAAALFPLLLLFSWKPALASLLLALPVLWASRLRSASLAASARAFGDSADALSRRVEDYAEGLEAAAGNGRLAEAGQAMSGAEARHEQAARRWELSKALFPPALEWLFFAALALLLSLAAPGGGGWTGSLIPFAALLLLLYRPLREWARAHPARLPGDRAWEAYRTLRDTLASLPEPRPAPRAPGAAIVCERLRFGYGGVGGGAAGGMRGAAAARREVFRALSLEIDPSRVTWIPGPNGSGKTTLLRLMAGVELPEGGRILLPASLPASGAFAYLPQRAVIEPDWPAWADAFARERAEEWRLLDGILGLEPLRERARGREARDFAAALSGGQRQRLALARVFASEAPCLLLDEPTTWLSGADRERILGDLLAFRARRPGAGAVLVSHEPFAGEFCSRTLRLEDADAGEMAGTDPAGIEPIADGETGGGAGGAATGRPAEAP